MANKPSTPKGTRDFGPQEMLRRKYIFSIIEKVFQKYGFLPLETPAMENLETLTGKYGEEGDRLIFKILNSGDAWKEVSPEVKEKLAQGEDVHPGKLATQLSEKALRYDLTVPFARYVVQHQSELAFPFKRYQIQTVWRADRPQKGRYREFYQCDADMIGSKSLLNEVDLLLIISEVFFLLGLNVEVKVNNRKVLSGLAELFGVKDRLVEFVVCLDKYDKGGAPTVMAELARKDFTASVMDRTMVFLEAMEKGGIDSRLSLRKQFADASVDVGLLGLDEVDAMMNGLTHGLNAGRTMPFAFTHDLSLARGLDYYTGAIFEVKALEGTLQSSICGGGRYDDLTGVFGLKGMSGVGISFGADRIYDVLLETGKFPADLGASTRVLFANFGDNEAMHCLKLLRQVREAGISAELYPDAVKMAKQFKYADDKSIPFVAIIGENEMKQGIVTVKDMKTGEQKAVKQEDLLALLA
ncbi:MAG: histidine--tRNA ligase [Flavobacteriales bacterium]|nr:MAG: histidine--tRNA ligase [Flavobacteriales bacterium]